MFTEGQGVKGKIRFKDGTFPPYVRVYLIVEANATEISILNISSIQGKAHKLLFPTNEEIKDYDPPFDEPSFAKLDSLTKIDAADWNKLKLIRNGDRISATELKRIKGML
jgi:hypothetical protein